MIFKHVQNSGMDQSDKVKYGNIILHPLLDILVNDCVEGNTHGLEM